MIKQVLKKTTENPRKLILLDGFGALLSAFLLGAVLTRFESTFGMPAETLYFLAILPVFFALYDFSTLLMQKKNWSPYLKIIAFANLAYCCISIGFVFHNYSKLTAFGYSYFSGELIIIAFIALLELKTAAKLGVGRA